MLNFLPIMLCCSVQIFDLLCSIMWSLRYIVLILYMHQLAIRFAFIATYIVIEPLSNVTKGTKHGKNIKIDEEVVSYKKVTHMFQ